MPLLKLETNVALPEEKRAALLTSLSKITAETIGKPETYVMVTVGSVGGLMAATAGPAAFADIRSIGGLNNAANRQLSARICKLLQDALGVPPDRVYLNFTDVEAGNWGWNGGTFG